MTENLNKPLPINSALVWDYNIPPAEKQTAAFRRWYLARVLTRGNSADLRTIGFETIHNNLPALNLPTAVRRFWEWYFNLPEVRVRYESTDPLSTTDHRSHQLKPTTRSFLFYWWNCIGCVLPSPPLFSRSGFLYSRPNRSTRVPAVLEDIARELNVKVTFTRTLGTFLQCFFQNVAGEQIQIDFAQDSPYRLQPVRLDEETGIQVENLVDIACNKLSALFDRAEPKDFVDIFFICQEVLPFDELVEQTKQKYLGLDDYWLAVALQQVEQVEILPRMIKPITLEELKKFFLDQAKIRISKIEDSE